MKRFFYVMFACACALLCFVSYAEAQTITTGDIVTIKTRNDNNYLAADANGTIYNCTPVNEDCYWLVTRTGKNTNQYKYTFQSLSSGKYLHAERTRSGNSYKYTLNLGEASSFTFSSNQLSANSCYVSYTNNWVGASSGTNLQIDVINDFTRQFINVAPANNTELDALTTITLTAKEGVVIKKDSFTKNSFTLTGGPTGASASISNVTASGNVLTITVANGDSEGDYTLKIDKGDVKDQYGISFAAASYSWKVVAQGHKYIDVTPATGETSAFHTITLTTDAEIMSKLHFGKDFEFVNDDKVSFTFTSENGATETSIMGQGVGAKRIDDTTLEITIPSNLGAGTYTLSLAAGAILGTDKEPFAAKTYTWTVNPHTFTSISPETVSQGEHLSAITLTAPEGVPMSIQDASKIVLKNAGNATVPTTATINAYNELVITPAAPLGNGSYTLNIAKGAVTGPHLVAFNNYNKTWNVIVSVSITHVNGFYPALGAGGYQQVHTVERTIYYTGNETSIPLTLAETNFFGYMRWYNYETDGGENINWITPPRARNNADFTPLEGNAKHLGWFAWAKSTGNDGVLERQSDQVSGNNTPAIDVSGWTGNHTIACDVSNYLDYAITRVDDKIVGVTEPKLSYRQLFHFKPASEMAAKLDTCTGDKYLETYYYTAPTNTDIYLATAYHHSMGNTLLNNYFYNVANPTRIPANNLSWYIGSSTLDEDYDTQDFQTVRSASTGEVIYYLRATVGSKTYNIAKFVVNYVDKTTYGPVKETGTNGSAKALISYNEMNNLYEVLEYNDFDFNQKSSTEENYLTTPLPSIESTYGFYYNADSDVDYNGGIPYYGEYSIVNRLNINNKTWASGANHVDGITSDETAGQQGYALYVDGTSEPGVVASISTKVTICGERTMYCSVWLRNPGSNNAKPIFRCNIQGRNRYSNGTYTPWEDVAVYFVGDLGYSSGWNQVRFPFVSQDTYSECRVQIYNFGIGVYGNDFWLDDLCIYADKLPMASYQLQTEMCCSPDHDGTTFTAAVLRVDYGINTLQDDREGDNKIYQYYQIFNKTTGQPFVLTSNSLSPYYDEHKEYTANGMTKEQYGSIEIMQASDTPSEAEILDPSTLIGNLLAAYHGDENTPKKAPLCGKCFVEKRPEEITTESPGKYYMYVVHIVPNIDNNRIQENYLQEHCEYTLRMTSDADNLLNTTLSCAIEIDLPSTQQSLFRLMSDQIETTEFLCNSTNNCANELYTLEAFIRKDSDLYSDQGEAEGTYLADWMYGYAFDEVYRMDYPHENDAVEHVAKDTADAKFARAYRCSREQVTNAFLDLRRVPTPAVGDTQADLNPNYYVTTFDSIKPQYFSDYRQDADTPSVYYETLKYLHNQGWLQLSTSSVSFYLGSKSKARYWVFPIENSAKADDGVTPLHDCPEPRWVEVSSKITPYYVNIAPGVDISSDAAKQAADPRTGTRIPNVRVLARLVNNTIQIPIHQASMNDYAVNFTGDDGYIFMTSEEGMTNPQAYKYTAHRSENVITLVPAAGNNAELKLGQQYTLCVRMRNKDNQYKPVGDNCDVGKIYMKLLILPDVVVWTPPTTDDTDWHNDANWSGYREDNGYHYAPIAGSGVVIQNGVHSPVLTEIAPANHPHPMDANFTLTPTCGQIYFQPGAMMLNQHLLQHDKVFVDLVVPNQTWNTITVPISGVVSGDMYIPHEGDSNNGISLESSDPFDVQPFKGSRVSTSAFPFWMSFYNRTVERVNDNPTLTRPVISTNTASFAPTNSLNAPMEVGSGYQLLGWGPNSMGSGTELTIRLPKPENNYNYYYSSGYLAEVTTVTRGENAGKFVYSPDELIQLTNEMQSQDFMFGNPTMSLIDLKEFLPENAVIYRMVNDKWEAETPTTLENTANRYLRPMESVLLRMPSAAQQVEVELPADYLTTYSQLQGDNSGNNSPAGGGTTISPAGVAPRRPVEKMTAQLMTIYADVYGTKARCILAAKDEAEDIYSLGEDALFISSGVEADVNDAAATTPVNMYTLAKGVPMMVDVRENIDTVPVALLIHDYYRTDKVTFTFYLTENWDKESYFCDAVTGTRTLITDSLVLEVAMPQNHEVRYFIDGPDVIDPDGGGDIWSSTEDVKTSANQVWAYSPSQGQLVVASNDIIKAVMVYDIAGRLIGYRELEMQYNSTTFDTPTGACIVKAVLRDNTEHYISALVK